MADGWCALGGRQGNGLFNPARRREASAWAFEALAAADVPDQVAATLADSATRWPCPALSHLNVTVLPADPTDEVLMRTCSGLSAYAVPGALALVLWPSPGNMARAHVAVVRAYMLAARVASVGAPRTFADLLVAEGLAAHAVAQAFPNTIDAPWHAAQHPADDWPHALEQVAHMFYELARYDDLVTNVYGQPTPVTSAPAPTPAALDADEHAYVAALLAEACTITHAATCAALLYGDTLVSARGHPPAGVPDDVGFGVAAAWVTTFLGGRDLGLGDALATPTAEVLAHACLA